MTVQILLRQTKVSNSLILLLTMLSFLSNLIISVCQLGLIITVLFHSRDRQVPREPPSCRISILWHIYNAHFAYCIVLVRFTAAELNFASFYHTLTHDTFGLEYCWAAVYSWFSHAGNRPVLHLGIHVSIFVRTRQRTHPCHATLTSINIAASMKSHSPITSKYWMHLVKASSAACRWHTCRATYWHLRLVCSKT